MARAKCANKNKEKEKINERRKKFEMRMRKKRWNNSKQQEPVDDERLYVLYQTPILTCKIHTDIKSNHQTARKNAHTHTPILGREIKMNETNIDESKYKNVTLYVECVCMCICTLGPSTHNQIEVTSTITSSSVVYTGCE